jgi:hypothetical protein
LGLFDRPVDEKTLSVLLKPPAVPSLTESLTWLGQSEWQTILARLRRARLLAAEDPSNPGQSCDFSDSARGPNKFAELMTLDAVKANQGVVTALIEALISRLQTEMLTVLRVTTTNDNLNACVSMRRGFRITQVRLGAVDKSRLIKPSISLIGEYGIPIRDEIELERKV